MGRQGEARTDRAWPGFWLLVSLSTLLLVLVQFSQVALAQNERVEDFEKHVRPVLRRECLGCHREGKASGSLALDSRAGWTRCGASAPGMRPAGPAGSPLVVPYRHRAD